ncbi:MAG: MAPEG family protein [Labilithrix sp.]
MMLLAELCGGSPLVLHLAGGIFLVARASHAIGMPRPTANFFRAAGVTGTWVLICFLAAWTLWLRRRGCDANVSASRARSRA